MQNICQYGFVGVKHLRQYIEIIAPIFIHKCLTLSAICREIILAVWNLLVDMQG